MLRPCWTAHRLTSSTVAFTLRPTLALAEQDPPVSVEIVGDLVSFYGTLNFAEVVAPTHWNVGAEGESPRQCLRGIVHTVWVGGTTKPGGDEIDETDVC